MKFHCTQFSVTEKPLYCVCSAHVHCLYVSVTAYMYTLHLHEASISFTIVNVHKFTYKLLQPYHLKIHLV